MAARKKVTKTAKSTANKSAIRSKTSAARAKTAAPKAPSVATRTTATKADTLTAKRGKSDAKPEKKATAAKSSSVKSEKVGAKADPVLTKPAKAPAKTAVKAEPTEAKVEAVVKVDTVAKAKAALVATVAAARSPSGPPAVKPEARPSANAQPAPDVKATPVRAAAKVAEISPETVKTADAPAPAMTAKAAKPAPSTKTIEREPSGGDQKTMKNSVNRHGFKLNEFVVYPAHGVGQIVAIEEQEVAGFKLELFVINFVKDKMTLRVPVGKVAGVGMRKLSDPDQARRSLEILTGRARIKRTMWSRRAQEYEAKINSGDINAIAEVVRDLFRSEAQPEQSYSERQLYEAALDRMMREIAAVQKTTEGEALKTIEAQLKKNTKRGAKAEPSDAADGDEAGIEEAA